MDKYRLIAKRDAVYHIHLPADATALHQARRRLKFEELFYNQLQLIKNKYFRKNEEPGAILDRVGLVQEFYEKHLPFELTGAQKRVLKEIHGDVKSGLQMNRLLQGDVGSGKTMVAFISSLMAISNEFQVCLMAPTEILAQQHYTNLQKLAEKLGIRVGRLMGSTKKKERDLLHEGLRDGTIQLLVGTHALLEEDVRFANLGLCIIDEQHRFGVAQRARLQEKNPRIKPHILVMTATPIPRTLAMTLYGDLDQSEIDELPPGRKPITTTHRFDKHRVAVFNFLKEQLAEGRQVYIVYPLIEESEKSDLKDLMDGYESVARAFPDTPLSIVHGKMKAKDKAYEMDRFARRETKILVATTVIEVGVDVPNATVMVIENAERFGLAQLHQLRGRVGRGGNQSYCILMTSYKLSADTRKRLETMCRTNNGFEIAQVDLELRGPGDLSGTQQSGTVELKVANLAIDGAILKEARISAQAILEQDPSLDLPDHQVIRQHVAQLGESTTNWSRIG
jgi:ATP-dependent DNA helicase RecG